MLQPRLITDCQMICRAEAHRASLSIGGNRKIPQRAFSAIAAVPERIRGLLSQMSEQREIAASAVVLASEARC